MIAAIFTIFEIRKSENELRKSKQFTALNNIAQQSGSGTKLAISISRRAEV